MASPYKNSARTDLIFLMCFFLGTFILTMEILEDYDYERHFALKQDYGSMATGLKQRNSNDMTPAPHSRNVMSKKRQIHTTYSSELSIPRNLTDMSNDVGGVFSSWALRPLSDEEMENFEDMYVNVKGSERRTIAKLLQSWGQLPIISTEDMEKDNNSLTNTYQKIRQISDKDTAYRIAMELEEQSIKKDSSISNGIKNGHAVTSGVGLDFALSGNFDETEDQKNNDKLIQSDILDNNEIIDEKEVDEILQLATDSKSNHKNMRSNQHILLQSNVTNHEKFEEIQKQNVSVLLQVPDEVDYIVDNHRSRSLARHRTIQQGIWEAEEPILSK